MFHYSYPVFPMVEELKTLLLYIKLQQQTTIINITNINTIITIYTIFLIIKITYYIIQKCIRIFY